MEVATIIEQKEFTVDEVIFVVQEYIKARKGVDVIINLDKNNPRHSLNLFWQQIHLDQLQKLDIAFYNARKWFFQEQQK